MLPTLYKYDTKGKVRQWDVYTEGSTVVQCYGEQGGKIQQKKYDAKPKNVGRSNETSAEQQAIREAEALHAKKIKIDDYHQDVDKSGKQLRPMLAHDFLKVPHKLQLPCMVQPKLDGVRALAYISECGRVEVQSRKGELYQATHEMSGELYDMLNYLEAYTGMDITLDGEYYIHGVPLGKLAGAAKKMQPLTEDLEFHIFDCIVSSDGVIDTSPFSVRYNYISEYIKNTCEGEGKIKLVECEFSEDITAVDKTLNNYIRSGYEGIMCRQDSKYEASRSYSLIKYKLFQDEEFKIIGHKADKENSVVWLVEVDTGIECWVTPMGELTQRQQWLLEADNYYGKLLKVKFQGYNEFGNLEFPSGVELDRTDS